MRRKIPSEARNWSQHVYGCPPGRARPSGSRLGPPHGHWQLATQHANPTSVTLYKFATRSSATKPLSRPLPAAATLPTVAQLAAGLPVMRERGQRPAARSETRIMAPAVTKMTFEACEQAHSRHTYLHVSSRAQGRSTHLFASSKAANRHPLVGGGGGQRPRHKLRLPVAPTTWERPVVQSEPTRHVQLECLLLPQEGCEAREAGAHRQCLMKGVQTNISASSDPAWSTYLLSKCCSQ